MSPPNAYSEISLPAVIKVGEILFAGMDDICSVA